ncbi:MAG: family 10 glycosylhydrolase [Candidatus Sumerlaeia bacterium]|nr:family 10 glycosylhydrolase [Candidatus Sumerlaeia bacterium]
MTKKSLKSVLYASALLLASSLSPPVLAQDAPDAEFRGAWITTAFSLDWPTGTGNSPTVKRSDLVSMIDTVEAAGMNAILFQVRSEGDAMYPSEYEPWSRFLEGTSGTAPARPWDPLQFAIDEARRRGLEVHAWVNPYRAGFQATSYAANHPSVTNPDGIVVPFTNTGGTNYHWFNPANPATRTYTRLIVGDILDRYDIDALHIDDYFYPYGINNDTHPFPDDVEYDAYVAGGGSMNLGDWRRNNINLLIEELYDDVRNHPERDHVRFGISPFGIWQPGNPPGITGLNSYATIYGDSRKWQQEGWGDYFSPQLYWGRSADGYPAGQDFDSLLGWWSNSTQNPLGRHIWPGIGLYRMLPSEQDWPAQQIINQIDVVQSTSGSTGSLFFRTAQLTANSGAGFKSITNELAAGPYSERTLPPASPWIDAVAPDEPTLAWSGSTGSGPMTVYWEPTGSKYPQWYVVHYSSDNEASWDYLVLPDWARHAELPGTGANTPTHAAIQAVDRVGNLSSTTSMDLSTASGPVPDPIDHTLLTNFEGGTPGQPYLWFLGSPSNLNVTGVQSNAETLESNNRLDPRIDDPGSIASRVRFDWTESSGGRLRLSTFNGANLPNPAIDLSKGLGFYFKLLEGELDLRLFIRETGGSGPIGANGGSSGPIEMTAPQRLSASPNWQYVHFDIPNEEYSSFASGNGELDGDWGVLEAFGIYQVASDSTTSFEIYFDDIHQGEPHTALGEPMRPNKLVATAGEESVSLEWGANHEIDLRGYRVYRSTTPGVAVGPDDFVAETTSTTFNDTGLTGNQTYHYTIAAVDHFHNLSFPAVEVSATAQEVVTDTTPPTSSASATATLVNTTSLTINFTASDDDSGVDEVELFVRTPGAGSFSSTGLTESGTSGSFSYTAAASDGAYAFYTIASDNAGNVESAPSEADVTVTVDTTAPTSSASATATLVNTTSLTVNFTASDATSGVDEVELFVRTPGAGSFSTTGLTESGTSGSFSYTAAAGDGAYAFYTVATDNAGNVESAPSEADVTVTVDTTAPTSSVDVSNDTQVGTAITGAYSASDAGSGVASVTLYVLEPGESWASAGTVTGGTFSHPATVAGLYGFTTVATDAAGNSGAAPAGSDAPQETVWFNPNENGPMSLEITGTGVYYFPMTNDINFLINVFDLVAPGTLTVQRILDASQPTGYNGDLIVDEYYTLTASNGLDVDNVTLVFGFEFDNVTAPLAPGDINRAFRDDNGTVTEFFAGVSGSGGVGNVGVEDVDGFSDWYFGNADADVTDWMLLDD